MKTNIKDINKQTEWIIITNRRDTSLTKYIDVSNNTSQEIIKTIRAYSTNFKVRTKRIV